MKVETGGSCRSPGMLRMTGQVLEEFPRIFRRNLVLLMLRF